MFAPNCNLTALRINWWAISAVIMIFIFGLSGNGAGVPIGSSSTSIRLEKRCLRLLRLASSSESSS